MKLSVLFFIIVVVSSCHSKYQLHEHYLSDAYEKSIDTVVYVPYRKGDKWFFIDRRTKGPYAGHAKAFEGEWNKARPFNSSNLAKVFSQEVWSFIDTTGKTVIKTNVEESFDWDYTEGVIALPGKDDLWGCMDTKGDTILSFQFLGIGKCLGGLIDVAYAEDNHAIFNREGEVVIDSGHYAYLTTHKLNSELIVSYGVNIKNEMKYGFIKPDIIVLTTPIFDDIPSFGDDRALVYMNGKYGYANQHGEVVIPCIYGEAYPFISGTATVSKNKLSGVIDKNGKNIIPLKFDELGLKGFQDNIMPFEQNDKWGVIDSNGKILVKAKYESAQLGHYKYGLIPVEKNGLIGMIDARGKEIITFREYESVLYFYPYTITPNRIVIKEKPKNGKYGLINRKNEAITPLKYSSIGKDDYFKVFENGLIPVGYYINGEYRKGYIDIWGKEYFED